MNQRLKLNGFTIVELLIVIVVIGILAAITVVAYGGIKGRASDARRLSDITAINTAILAYHAVNGVYPSTTPSPGVGGVEMSTDTTGSFMEQLKNGGFLANVPLDPTNNSSYFYSYYLYPIGWGGGANGCDDSRGPYYVLSANLFESGSGAQTSSPGFSCSGRNWQGSGGSQWVTGGYTN